MVILSILLQSTNKRCNYLQSILGIFYHSASVPEKVIETLAHAGMSITLTSIHNTIKSLSQEASQKLHNSVSTLTMAFTYDNFNMTFWVAEPTVGKDTMFVSATSATAILIYGLDSKEDLRCSAELWEKDPNNPDLPSKITVDNTDLLQFHHKYGTIKKPGEEMSAHAHRLSWYVHNIWFIK